MTGAAALGILLLCGTPGTQDAVANGDTRTITLLHEHTKETASITFRRNGQYDTEALNQLNWMLRDWRLDQPTRMDPRLFDIVWQVYREVGATEPIHVVSAYRAPETNAALRRRSRAVAEQSQHMLGKAMDFYIPDASMRRVREIGMRLQRGGVGFYPNAFNPFVHLDAGSVRSWPRMSGPELARLFPDGRTVHMPRHGKPLPGYEDAKAMILARGGTVPGMGAVDDGDEDGRPRRSLWATLFGGRDDEDAEFYRSQPSRAAPTRVATSAPNSGGSDGGALGFLTGVFGQAPAPGERPSPGPDSAPDHGAGPTAPAVPIPLPPRRPADIAGAAPSPIARPVTLAFAGTGSEMPGSSTRGEMRPAVRTAPTLVGADERAALRSLFDAAATPTGRARAAAEIATAKPRVQPFGPDVAAALVEPGTRIPMGFSTASLDAPEAGSFTGPAVAPLRVLR